MFCRFGLSVKQSQRDPVEAELVLEAPAHLLGRAREDVDAHARRAPSRAAASPRRGSCASRRAARAPCARDRAACRSRCGGTSCRGPSGRCAAATGDVALLVRPRREARASAQAVVSRRPASRRSVSSEVTSSWAPERVGEVERLAQVMRASLARDRAVRHVREGPEHGGRSRPLGPATSSASRRTPSASMNCAARRAPRRACG